METPTPNLLHLQIVKFLAQYITDEGRNEMLKKDTDLDTPRQIAFYNQLKTDILVQEHHPDIQFNTFVVGTDENKVIDKLKSSSSHVLIFTYANIQGSLTDNYAARDMAEMQIGVYYPNDPKGLDLLERMCVEMDCLDYVKRIQFEMRQNRNNTNNELSRWMEERVEYIPNELYDRIGSVLTFKCNPMMYL